MRQITTKMPPCIAQSLIKEDYLMKKRLLAIVLSIVLIVGLLPISAFAADTWTTKLHVSKNTSVTYNSKYAVEVGFGVQSDTLTLKNLQSIVFAVDLTVFDFIYYDADSSSAASYMEYFSENLSTDDLSTVVYQKYTSGTGLSKISWDAKPYVAKNGNTGYMVLQPTCTKNTSCTSEVILASILLGLKTSKDFTDITESSIRLATSEEAKALSQVKVVMLTDGDANTQEYGKIDGGSDTLTVTPTVSWDGFTFSPTHAADTSRTESDATKHWNPCANHTDCGKRFNEDDHSWGSDGKCTVCSYLCSHASGYNYTYVDANNHSKTCTTCGKVENEPHTQKTAATCTAAATCSKCNHNYGPALGHTLTYTPSVVATCKVEGHIEYWHCSKCNNYYADKDAKTELSADAVKPALNPTNHVRTEIKSIKAPTCTETGYTGDKWCLDCNTKIKDGSSIPALGHTFTTGEGDNTKPNYVPAGTGRYGITIERVKCVNCDAYDETNANAVKASLPINVSLRVQKDAASISNPPAKVQFIFALYKIGRAHV